MSFIQLNDIVKEFHDQVRETKTLAIDRVSLSVEKKEFVCLIGPSGCGKSTLLNMVAGFEKPTRGDVLVDGRPILGPGADRGMVFQQPNLMPWLPVWDNIAFALKLKGHSKEQRQEAAQPFIDAVKLKGFERHFPSELSGGMAQRVGIASKPGSHFDGRALCCARRADKVGDARRTCRDLGEVPQHNTIRDPQRG